MYEMKVDSENRELQGYNAECLQTTLGVIKCAASTSTEGIRSDPERMDTAVVLPVQHLLLTTDV